MMFPKRSICLRSMAMVLLFFGVTPVASLAQADDEKTEPTVKLDKAWHRDLDEARKIARRDNKPMFVAIRCER